jgi:hypothetical protein
MRVEQDCIAAEKANEEKHYEEDPIPADWAAEENYQKNNEYF